MFDALREDSDSETDNGTHSTSNIGKLNNVLVKHNNEAKNQFVATNDSSSQKGGTVVQLASEIEINDELPFDSDDLAITIRVCKVIGENIHLLRRLSSLKPLRAALHPLITEQLQNGYLDSSITKNDYGKKRKRGKNNKILFEEQERKELLKEVMKQKEREHLNNTQLRAVRLKQLESLYDGDKDEVIRIADGVALTLEDGPVESSKMLLEGTPGNEDSGTYPGVNANTDKNPVILDTPIKCYICKKHYLQLHFFYHSLCPDCSEFNYMKRSQKCDLTGRVCLVTGGRQKIGYRATLKLLRCGATVCVTTRFPADCAGKYAREKDYETFKNRLQIFGLDFRDLNALENFCVFFEKAYDRLDFLLNNAAQTIRRPPSYYAHLMDKERAVERLLSMTNSDPTTNAYNSESKSRSTSSCDSIYI